MSDEEDETQEVVFFVYHCPCRLPYLDVKTIGLFHAII